MFCLRACACHCEREARGEARGHLAESVPSLYRWIPGDWTQAIRILCPEPSFQPFCLFWYGILEWLMNGVIIWEGKTKSHQRWQRVYLVHVLSLQIRLLVRFLENSRIHHWGREKGLRVSGPGTFASLLVRGLTRLFLSSWFSVLPNIYWLGTWRDGLVGEGGPLSGFEYQHPYQVAGSPGGCSVLFWPLHPHSAFP